MTTKTPENLKKTQVAWLTERIKLTRRAKDVEVTSIEEKEEAVALIRDLKARGKEVEAAKKKIVGPINEGLKRIRELFGPFEVQLKEAVSSVNCATMIWDQGVEAERKRVQYEVDRLAEKERQKLNARAEKAEASGKPEKAEALRSTASSVQTPVAPKVPKTSGYHYREDWVFEILDAGLVPRSHCVPDEKALLALARAEKENASLPGVRFFSRKTPVSSG